MKGAKGVLALALSLLTASPASAVESSSVGPARQAVARVVEIRVSGDATALSRVRMTARELLRRLDVQPNVRAADEPETASDGATPLVVAYVDLRRVATPSIEIQDGRTRQELTHRQLSEVTSLETGVEAVLHVLYLSVESALQVGGSKATVASARDKPAPPATPPKRPIRQAARFGLDVGPLLRLSSLGGTRIVPGGGLSLEPRAQLGRGQAGVLVSGAMHGASELSFARGVADIWPLQLRVIPTLDWPVSADVSGCVGVGGGLDSFVVQPVQAPEAGSLVQGQGVIDPVITGLVGARIPVSARVFLSALASLDLDLAPSSFVVRAGGVNQPILRLPRLRAGLTLAVSITAAGEQRFASTGFER